MTPTKLLEQVDQFRRRLLITLYDVQGLNWKHRKDKVPVIKFAAQEQPSIEGLLLGRIARHEYASASALRKQ